MRVGAGGGAPAAQGPDEFFGNVTLLLDFAGADEGTDTADLSSYGHAETFVGAAVLDTDLTYLDVNSMIPAGSTGRINFPSHISWELPIDESFTWECGVRFTSTSGVQTLLSNFDGATGGWIRLNAGEIIFVNQGTPAKTETWVPSTGVWYHVAVTRDVDQIRTFIDGVELGTATTYGNRIWQGGEGFHVGAARVSTESMTGNIGAVRITKGVARYTEAFTPPTEFYPTTEAAAGPNLSDLSATNYSYTGKVGAGSDDFQGVTFNPDGTKMFCSRDTEQDLVAFDLSSAWDVSTMAYDDELWDVTDMVQPQDHFWSTDGTVIVVVASGSDKYFWATCSTPFDLSTAGSTSEVAVGESAAIPGAVWFSEDGLTMLTGIYVSGADQDIFKYTLSTPFVPSSKGAGTAVLDTLVSQTFPGYGMVFAPNGLKFYLADTLTSLIHQYALTTAFDLTTAIWSQSKASGGGLAGLHMRPDGTEIYSCHDSSTKLITRWA